MEVLVNLLRPLRCDLGHGGQLRHRRLPHPARRAQGLEQARADRRPHAGNGVERGLDRALAAELLVIGDREPVRLVTDLLERVQRWRSRIEQQRIAVSDEVYFYLTVV